MPNISHVQDIYSILDGKYSRNTIKRWIYRDSVEDKPKGRPSSKLTDSVKKKIEEEMKERPGVGTR